MNRIKEIIRIFLQREKERKRKRFRLNKEKKTISFFIPSSRHESSLPNKFVNRLKVIEAVTTPDFQVRSH